MIIFINKNEVLVKESVCIKDDDIIHQHRFKEGTIDEWLGAVVGYLRKI